MIRLCRNDDRLFFSITLGWPVWAGDHFVTFAPLCMAIGALNGRHRGAHRAAELQVVTLAFLFILRGFTIYLPQLIERKTIIGGIDKAADGAGLGPCTAGRSWADFSPGSDDVGIIAVVSGKIAGQPVVDGYSIPIIFGPLGAGALRPFRCSVSAPNSATRIFVRGVGDGRRRGRLCRRWGPVKAVESKDPDVHSFTPFCAPPVFAPDLPVMEF